MPGCARRRRHRRLQMRKQLGPTWGIGISRLMTVRIGPGARVRTTAYKRMCESAAIADCKPLHHYIVECLSGAFRRMPPFEFDQFAHCLYERVSTTAYFVAARPSVASHSLAITPHAVKAAARNELRPGRNWSSPWCRTPPRNAPAHADRSSNLCDRRTARGSQHPLWAG